jgi:tyrosyl-tRNA synthetase
VTLESSDGQLGIAYLLKAAGLVTSTSEAFRMIQQGAVRIDGVRVEDRALKLAAGTTGVYQVGKRKFSRVSVT